MRRVAMSVVLGVALAGPAAFAQTPHFTVVTNFPKSLNQPSITEQVQSFITRELRSLPDVTVGGQNADFFLSVVGEPLKLDNGHVAGVAISYVIQDLRTDLILHEMVVGPPANLQAMCQKLVARFDVHFLEPRR